MLWKSLMAMISIFFDTLKNGSRRQTRGSMTTLKHSGKKWVGLN